MSECSFCKKFYEANTKLKRFCSPDCQSLSYRKKRHELNHSFRKRMKLKAVEYKGGKCEKCGYNRCIQALEFHHVEPEHKDFSIAQSSSYNSWNRIRDEIDKCQMLCSNCHKEAHYGLTDYTNRHMHKHSQKKRPSDEVLRQAASAEELAKQYDVHIVSAQRWLRRLKSDV